MAWLHSHAVGTSTADIDVPVSQRSPLKAAGHKHVDGEIHVPLFLHGGEHRARRKAVIRIS